MQDKVCPFRKETINTGWGGADGSYPLNQVEMFLPCIDKDCMAWHYGCKLIDVPAQKVSSTQIIRR